MNIHYLTKVEGRPGQIVAHFKTASGKEVRVESGMLEGAIAKFIATNPPGKLEDLTGARAAQRQPAPAGPVQAGKVDLLNVKRKIPDSAYMSGDSTRWMSFVGKEWFYQC